MYILWIWSVIIHNITLHGPYVTYVDPANVNPTQPNSDTNGRRRKLRRQFQKIEQITKLSFDQNSILYVSQEEESKIGGTDVVEYKRRKLVEASRDAGENN